MQQVVFFLTDHLWNTWHVIHDHVKIFHILERKMKLNDPFWIGMGHNVPLFPEKGGIGPLDLNINNYFNNIELLFFFNKINFYHFKFAKKFHSIHFLGWLVPDKLNLSKGTPPNDFDDREVLLFDS